VTFASVSLEAETEAEDDDVATSDNERTNDGRSDAFVRLQSLPSPIILRMSD
jgi:hypothetical protein